MKERISVGVKIIDLCFLLSLGTTMTRTISRALICGLFTIALSQPLCSQSSTETKPVDVNLSAYVFLSGLHGTHVFHAGDETVNKLNSLRSTYPQGLLWFRSGTGEYLIYDESSMEKMKVFEGEFWKAVRSNLPTKSEILANPRQAMKNPSTKAEEDYFNQVNGLIAFATSHGLVHPFSSESR
jgi:hypothetical protein